MEHCLKDLSSVGCICRDIGTCTVDFPIKVEGEIVFLCWKLGEDNIDHFHPVNNHCLERVSFIAKTSQSSSPAF
ncbi:DUF2203 domain-containing protein [Patescibacteria group bacterium]|nr:DUF2203 domain-containing protein [Patescibacteria group bacterium]